MGTLFTRCIVRLTALVCLLMGLVWLMLTRPAVAAGVVTNCTEAGFAAAWNNGSGNISFNCGPAPVIITMTNPGGYVAVPGYIYSIDGSNGGNRITLSGGNANRLFDVRTDAALTLTNITLTDGYAATGGDRPTQGGAILVDGGALVLDNVVIRNSQSTFSAGAIEVAAGVVSVNNSLIENNQSDYGGAIDSIGTLTLFNTTVRYNHALGHSGGGLDVGGTVFINNSQIYSNTAATFGGGIFSNNALTLTQSTLSDNRATSLGGGVANDGTATLNNSTLSGNAASDGGGGIANYGTMTLNNSTLSGNQAAYGGGIQNYRTATLNNSTLSGNRATFIGGDGGGGIFHFGSVATKTVTLKNTIVANSPVGGNCYREAVSVSGSTIVSLGYNLSSDTSCQSFLNQPSDLPPFTDPNLGPLANNGGPTLTHMPLTPDSPGIDAIPHFVNGCGTTLSSDQRGAPRPINLKCDIGSVEYGALLLRLWLPLTVR